MSYRYANQLGTFITRESDGACIPTDPMNSDYAEILKNNYVVAPHQAPPPPPPVAVTPWQAREALRLAGRLADVDALIDSLGSTHQAYIAYHYAERFMRTSPLIATFGAQLNMSDAELDKLFEVAHGLSL